MGYFPPALVGLINNLSRLPGIGRKTATRLALHLLRQPEEMVRDLAGSIVELKEKIRFCSLCYNFTEQDPCPMCRDDSRATGVLCVVEGPGDLMALEATGAFKGRYHVLGGALSPLSGVGPGELRLAELLDRLDKERVTEVLLATSSNPEGEATANYLAGLIKAKGARVTRIAQGVPMGAELEYLDEATLKKALISRREA
ncbi:MAG: recombination mediator RecR [Pseudomonadota bacterium]